ncbi:hypothetical protein BJ165DRAFT_1488481 [Panaeolus papilionaceus]|nr:hypothetical protein BJ165DRAFT_1488481 [Panaeolus papilionaceus]
MLTYRDISLVNVLLKLFLQELHLRPPLRVLSLQHPPSLGPISNLAIYFFGFCDFLTCHKSESQKARKGPCYIYFTAKLRS